MPDRAFLHIILLYFTTSFSKLQEYFCKKYYFSAVFFEHFEKEALENPKSTFFVFFPLDTL